MEGGEDDTEGGKRETEKMSQSWTEKWREREQGRRRKRAPSIPYLCYLKPFECT